MTAFDPATFIDQTISEPSTKRPPLPAGRDYIGVIGEPKPRPWQGKQDPSKSGMAIDYPVTVDLSGYPDVKEKLGGLPQVTLTYSIMVDTTDAGLIDNSPGKNGRLRQFREALNLNKPGDTFSWRMAQGRSIKLKVKHREYQGDLYDEVDSVARV